MATKTVTIPCAGLDETAFHLASSTFNNNFTSTSYPYTSLQDDGTGSSYARINVDKSASTTSYVYARFDCSSIPRGSKITAIQGYIRLYSTGNQVSLRRVRWCITNNSTYVTNTQSFSTSSNPTALETNIMTTSFNNTTGSTFDKMNHLRCYIEYIRNSRTDNTQRYIYLYGSHLTITYDEPLFYIKDSNNWTHASNKLYRKVNGVWVQEDSCYLEDNNIKYLKRG